MQYLSGSNWVDVPGGSVTGNNLVWRKFTFSPISTTAIRVQVNAALATVFPHHRGRGVDRSG